MVLSDQNFSCLQLTTTAREPAGRSAVTSHDRQAGFTMRQRAAAATLRVSTVLAGALLFGLATPVKAADPGPAATSSESANATLVAQGKYLVTAGDCAACHTAPGGQQFAGNYAINSPFGIIYTPNITPDKETGIGNWSEAEFYHLFHEGRGPNGEYIYPAFPYDWFTKVTKPDVDAIYAYLMSLPPVHEVKKHNQLMFPLNIRFSVFGWNLLFFNPGTFQADPSKSAEINRGAYLVEGLEHCGDCHTPKNIAQGPIRSMAYSGGVIDHWYAPNITSGPQGIGKWSDDALFHYLRTGIDPNHGLVLGPMAEAVRYSLARLNDSDVHAIVAYLKSTKPLASYEPKTPAYASDQRAGADVYVTYCASCHQRNGEGVKGRIPALANNGAVIAKGAQNVIRVVLGGLRAQGDYGPMPGFAAAMSDQQIADVTNYVRGAWTNKAPLDASPGEVAAAAKETKSLLAGTQPCPPRGTSAVDAAISDPSTGIQAVLDSTTEENLVQSANKIITIFHAKVPDAKRADIVNETTDAYCPVVMQQASLEPIRHWQEMTEFGERLYTQLADHEAR
jgi:mono/diheme cytochrome c family protein